MKHIIHFYLMRICGENRVLLTFDIIYIFLLKKKMQNQVCMRTTLRPSVLIFSFFSPNDVDINDRSITKA